MRARAHAEEQRGGRAAIVISELPYGVKKGGDEGVIAKMAELVKSGVLSEISRLRDSSDKSGMRIVVELKRDAIPQVVLNKLFKHTALQSTFGYNAVALVDGVPEDAVAARAPAALPRVPAHRRRPPLEVRAAEGRGARARPRGLPGRARQPRRRDRADPRGRGHRRGAHGPDGDVRPLRDPGAGDPRPPPPRADRARAEARRDRARRPARAHRRAPHDPRRRGARHGADPRGAARAQGDLRQERRPAHRDRRTPRASSTSRI